MIVWIALGDRSPVSRYYILTRSRLVRPLRVDC